MGLLYRVKRKVGFALAALLCLVLCAPPAALAAEPALKITANATSNVLYIGETAVINLTLEGAPNGASIVWESLDRDLVAVNAAGTVSIIGTTPGSATIRANVTYGEKTRSASYKVQVRNRSTPTRINITGRNTIYLQSASQDLELTAKVLPADAVQTVEWSIVSTPASIAEIDSATGKVTLSDPPTAGSAVVTATSTAAPSLKSEFKISIVDSNGISPTRVEIASKEGRSELLAGSPTDDYLELTATVYPAGASQKVVWTSANDDIAIVDADGKVSPVNPGRTFIYAATPDGKRKSSFRVDVRPKPTAITTRTDPLYINANKQLNVTARYVPRTAYQGMVWKSDNEAVATVSASGVVKGISKGSGPATITVSSRADDTLSASFKVYVINEPLKSVKFNLTAITIADGSTYNARAAVTLLPKSSDLATDFQNQVSGAVKFISSKENIASVDSETGEITAHARGSATISCVAADGRKASMRVTVRAKPQKIFINDKTTDSFVGYLRQGEPMQLRIFTEPTGSANTVNWWVDPLYANIVTIAPNGVVTSAVIGKSQLVDIKATSIDGSVSATGTLHLIYTPITRLRFQQSRYTYSSTLSIQDELTIVPEFADAGNKAQDIIYTSSRSKVATIDAATGALTRVGKGSTVITAKSKDGGYRATCTVVFE